MRERLFYHSLAEREAMLGVVRKTLEIQSDVTFAYVHGSFLAEQPFHDVDIAVYFIDTAVERLIGRRLITLRHELSHPLGCTFSQPTPEADVRALNLAPLGFCYQVLRGGRLLLSRDEAARIHWETGIVARYLDVQPLRRQALKEAMTA
jgi:hypothetical protein